MPNNNLDNFLFLKKRKRIIICLILFVILISIILSTILLKANFNLNKIRCQRFKSELKQVVNKRPGYQFIGDSEIINKIRSNGSEVFDLAEKETNVAINYSNQWKHYNKTGNDWHKYDVKACNTTIPGLSLLRFENIYWQTIEINGKTVYHFYNAYYDKRGTVKMVRVITSQHSSPKSKLWCLIYFDGKRQPIITESEKFGHRNQVKAPYEVVLFSCKIPAPIEHLVPRAVSLIPKNRCPTKVSNLLRVIYERIKNSKQEFAVCHKSLRFAEIDLSLRLIEWLELIKIMGVSKVYLYSLATHPNMEKVLDYYQDLGFVDWRFTTLPGNQINNRYLYQYYHQYLDNFYWPQERLELNDCFYRNLYNYEYIVNFDLDEIIVPNKAYNWSQMIKDYKSRAKKVDTIETYTFHGSKVYSNIMTESNQLSYSLSHFYRTPIRAKNPKCIHSSARVKYLATHTAHGCLEGVECRKALIYPRDGYFLHYRIGYEYNATNAKNNDLIFDSIMRRYGKQLEIRVKIALNYIFH